MRGKPVESSHRHGPGSSGDRTLCAAVGSAAAAFFFTTNASRKVTLALLGSGSTDDLLLLDLGLARLLDGRRARWPARSGPIAARAALLARHNRAGSGGRPKRRHADPKKSNVVGKQTGSRTHPIRRAFENGAQRYLLFRNWMKCREVFSFSVINQMAPTHVWGCLMGARVSQRTY